MLFKLFVFVCLPHSEQAKILALLAPLYVCLMSACVNGVFPNLKLAAALKNAHSENALFHTRPIDAELCCVKLGNRIRMMAAKYREVKLSEDSYNKGMAKAWGLHTQNDQFSNLKKLSGFIKFGNVDKELKPWATLELLNFIALRHALDLCYYKSGQALARREQQRERQLGKSWRS